MFPSFFHTQTLTVAVVLAPRDKPSIGIFRLTDPPGLSIISQCKQGTNFHLHPYVPLYTEAGSDKGGHVTILPHIHEVRLIDLRDGE